MHLNLIVAVCEGFGIGLNGSLPWKLPQEMKFFARMTKTTRDGDKKNAVLMGRKTWDSIPAAHKPLKGRLNVVLTRQADLSLPKGVIKASGLNQALEELKKHEKELETLWLIGGSSLYSEAVESGLCHRIYLTEILKKFDCDVFLEGLNLEKDFDLIPEEQVEGEGVPKGLQSEGDVQYRYRVYQKK